MIDPTNLPTPRSSIARKQEFLLFCIMVAGKHADHTARKLQKFLEAREKGELPFDFIQRNYIHLHNLLVANKVGQYYRIEMAFRAVSKLNVNTCTLQDLMYVHGIGPKTARFFLLHTRKNAEYAVLDTHVLKWLSYYFDDVPKSTPNLGNSYEKWERLFINLARSIYGKEKSMADIDLLIWLQMSGRLDHQ